MLTCAQNKAIGTMLAVSISYGLAGVTAREMQGELATWQQIGLQNFLGAFLLVAMNWVTGTRALPKRITRRNIPQLATKSLVGRLLGSFLFIKACQLAPIGNVALISAIPLTVLFARLSGEAVSRMQSTLLVVGLLGFGIIVSPDFSTSFTPGMGEVYAFLSVLASSVGTVAGRDLADESDLVSVTFWNLFTAGMTALIIALLTEEGFSLPTARGALLLGLVVGMVVLNAAGSQFGFQHLSSSLATSITSLEALWALVIGYVVYAEQPSLRVIIGGSIILVSVVAMTRTHRSRQAQDCPSS